MKYQVLFSLKNNEKIFKTFVCCSRDWRLKISVWCSASEIHVPLILAMIFRRFDDAAHSDKEI